MRFAYYCSGHGYGHATRVSAFAAYILSLNEGHSVHIISSAPSRVFADSILVGAEYRNAHIDPVIVQPLAYRVDRQASVDVLRKFIEIKDIKLTEEVQWLHENKIDCVLSDAAFLGCLAAHHAGLPSVLITNFTFDSVYSYLATTLFDQSKYGSRSTLLVPDSNHAEVEEVAPDRPVPTNILEPLVQHIVDGYRCADLLFLLPGAIPIPSFLTIPPLPSPQWIDATTLAFSEDVAQSLRKLLVDPQSVDLLPSQAFPHSINRTGLAIRNPSRQRRRKVVPAPLIVRPPSGMPLQSPYTHEGRANLLGMIGVPENLHKNKVLLVSFGGQVFKPPRSRSRSRERASPQNSLDITHLRNSKHVAANNTRSVTAVLNAPTVPGSYFPSLDVLKPTPMQSTEGTPLSSPPLRSTARSERPQALRLASASHIFIPGAPPVRSPLTTPLLSDAPTFTVNGASPTPLLVDALEQISSPTVLPPTSPPLNDFSEDETPGLLPDDSWIAIVCGVSKDWGKDEEHGLPEGFYVAPRDAYMPDLTAVADVLLGKLGYGTVAECVDACTPFVFVSRPLFVEEHGLRLLLDQQGVGVELARADYEEGYWTSAVREAYSRGCDAKAKKRAEEYAAMKVEMARRADLEGGVWEKGVKVGGAAKREQEGQKMAKQLVDWTEEWWQLARK